MSGGRELKFTCTKNKSTVITELFFVVHPQLPKNIIYPFIKVKQFYGTRTTVNKY